MPPTRTRRLTRMTQPTRRSTRRLNNLNENAREQQPDEDQEEISLITSVIRDDSCIDLTRDDDATSSGNSIIDLTTVGESPIVLNSLDDSVIIERRSNRRRGPLLSVSSEEPVSKTKSSTSRSSKGIICPICLDDQETVVSSSRKHFMSTTCGHIFCNLCLKQYLHTQKSCPTCRKSLKENQHHQIFI